jgi:amidohydrolase
MMSEEEFAQLRGRLHACAERSHHERETAAVVAVFLEKTGPDSLHRQVGGYGLVAEYRGHGAGPTLLLRCELDALPLFGGRGAAHLCGHDGHMTILCGTAHQLGSRRPESGRVLLLFQPAEETGEGAQRVLEDERLTEFEPDWAFALHNLPGYPKGHVVVREGPFASGSRGLAFALCGASAHAAEPERGRSPVLAAAELVSAFSTLPQTLAPLHEAAKVTVIHVCVGEPAFGTAPGEGVVMATLRASTNEILDGLDSAARSLAFATAHGHGLRLRIETREPFPATINALEAVRVVRGAAQAAGLPVQELDTPFGWSEDFSHFTQRYRGALFGLGAGINHPALHHPDYDFPEGLLVPGIHLFERLIACLCGDDQPPA